MTVAQAKKPPYPTDRLVTGKEFGDHPEWGYVELVRGKVVPVSPPKKPHGNLVAELTYQLMAFVKKKKLGEVVSGDSGFYISHEPDTVRGPDVYFIRAERVKNEDSEDYPDTPPDLCVEVVSPTDKWSDVTGKVEEYLTAGVTLVWVIDPSRKKAHIYRKGREPKALDLKGKLDGEDVLPGFTLAMKELFAGIR